MTVAALFIDPRGPYPELLGPEHCWDATRDARTYPGPWPVVAPPPCERWGRYWSGGPGHGGKKLGDDSGCFAAALAAVRHYGGVLEHPEASHAWRAFGLTKPKWRAGWVDAGDGHGLTCCVAQGNYGHRARKLTWLYCVGPAHPPELDWSIPKSLVRLDDGFHSAEERRSAVRTGVCQRLSKLQRLATPLPFARLLISLAELSHMDPP